MQFHFPTNYIYIYIYTHTAEEKYLRTALVEIYTWEFPWLASVKVDLSNADAAERAVVDLGSQIKGYELLIRRMEPEPWLKTLFVYILPTHQRTRNFVHSHSQHYKFSKPNILLIKLKQQTALDVLSSLK